MKMDEIRSLSTVEMGSQLDEVYHELFNMRLQVSTGQQKNTDRLVQLRKDIARLKTELRTRELVAFEATEEE